VLALVFGGGYVYADAVVTDHGCALIGVSASSRTVDTHVAVLRRKLGQAPEEAGYVVTVAKTGYRLRA
jgi:DNA-binding response OmpR family regulator